MSWRYFLNIVIKIKKKIQIYIIKYVFFLLKWIYYIYLYKCFIFNNLKIIKNKTNKYISILNRKKRIKYLKVNKKFSLEKVKNKKYKIKKQRKNKHIYKIFIFIKRKNLFLTALDIKGNVLLKGNIGSYGFKDKVKFTGFALEKTSTMFMKRVRKKIIYKTKSKLKFILNKQFYSKKRNSQYSWYLKYVRRLRKKNFFIWWKKTFSKRKNIKKKIKIKIYIYRRYDLFDFNKFFIKFIKKLKYTLILKNHAKYWALRYALKGFKKGKLNVLNIEFKQPKWHSKGFRLRKQRRI